MVPNLDLDHGTHGKGASAFPLCHFSSLKQIFQDLPPNIRKKGEKWKSEATVAGGQIRYHWKIPFILEIFLINDRKIITVEQAKLFLQELIAKYRDQNSGLEDTEPKSRAEGGEIRKRKEKKKGGNE